MFFHYISWFESQRYIDDMDATIGYGDRDVIFRIITCLPRDQYEDLKS